MMPDEQEKRLALCANEKCLRKKYCMRFRLIGDNSKDTWVEFKPVKNGDKVLCKYFIHANSEDAKNYIRAIYKNDRAGGYEDA